MAKTTPTRVTEKTAMGQALKRLRKRADLTQEQAAENAGVVVQSWRRYEWGQRDLSYDLLAKLAAAVGARREDLIAECGFILGKAPSDLHREAKVIPFERAPGAPVLTVRDRVQAGAWLLADDNGQEEPRTWPAIPDPRYPHAPQWLSEVVGDSVNLLRIFEGDLVQCVDAVAIAYSPKTGDVVEVERVRFQGAERELTIKQVEVTPAGWVLWPRSSNARWSEPLVITEGMAETEEAEIRIRALVVSLIRRFPS